MVEDLKTKLKLFVEESKYQRVSPIELFKQVTKDNPILKYLKVYISAPEAIDSLNKNIFYLSSQIKKNIPIVLNDLRDYLVERLDENLEANAGELKASAISMNNALIDARVQFISKNWKALSENKLKVPKSYTEDPISYTENFAKPALIRMNDEIDKMDKANSKLTYVSDYWKLRGRKTLNFLKDIPVPLHKGKYGLKHVLQSYRGADITKFSKYERIPYIKPPSEGR